MSAVQRAMLAAVLVLAFGPAAASAVVQPPGLEKSTSDGVADTPVEYDREFKGHGHQHGQNSGHLPASDRNVDLVGKLRFGDAGPGRVTDVSALGNFAYLGTYFEPTCEDGGVYVADISDPRNPRQAGFIPTSPGSFVGEGVQAIHIDTPSFKGDVLAHSNEVCGIGGNGGMSLWDVTNPRDPEPLALHAGDPTPGPLVFAPINEIHSVFIWQQGDRAYAVLVDNYEFPDVDIFDITNPRTPVPVSERSIRDWPQARNAQSAGIGSFRGSFLHDMVVKQIDGHWYMLLSYWDAGYIVLNIDDPSQPVFVEDSDFPAPDALFAPRGPEGNAHYAEWDRRNRYILAADEDFSPFGETTPLSILTGPNADQEYPATGIGGAAPISTLADKKLNGPTVWGGYGCPPGSGNNPASPGSDPIPHRSSVNLTLRPGEEAILVLQRGPVGDPDDPETACFPGEKAENAINAGWDAVIIVNRHLGSAAQDSPTCGSGGFPDDPPIVAACTTHTAGHVMFNTTPDYDNDNPNDPILYDPEGSEKDTEPEIGSVGERVEIEALFDGWGYLRQLDAKTLEEIDAYAIPEARDPRYASGFGDLSIHETATDPTHDLAYISWYTGGLRVMGFGPGGLEELGHFIDTGGNNFWGVEVHRTAGGERYILASDRDSGLYIFRYGADVGISQTATASTTTGGTITYTHTVTNTGSIAGTNTTVSNPLPAGVTFLSADASQGTCSGTTTVVCNLGTLSKGGTARVTITARADTAGSKVNTATVSAPEVDPNTANNSATATTAVTAPAGAPAAEGATPAAHVSVRASGVPRGCVRSNFTLRVRVRSSGSVRRVQVYLDGKRIRTTRSRRFDMRIPAARMRRGRHRVTVVATNDGGARDRSSSTFVRCAAVRPRFTG